MIRGARRARREEAGSSGIAAARALKMRWRPGDGRWAGPDLPPVSKNCRTMFPLFENGIAWRVNRPSSRSFKPEPVAGSREDGTASTFHVPLKDGSRGRRVADRLGRRYNRQSTKDGGMAPGGNAIVRTFFVSHPRCGKQQPADPPSTWPRGQGTGVLFINSLGRRHR